MFTDLFVHRTTAMLKATGLAFPGPGRWRRRHLFGIDDRDVPDVATVVADFPEGVQGLVTATMWCEETPVPQIIRGHFGSFEIGNGEEISSYNFFPSDREVTHLSKLKKENYEIEGLKNSSLTHFTNFVESAKAGKPENVNCSPELGAAAMVIVKLGSTKLPRRQSVPFRQRRRCRSPTATRAGRSAGKKYRRNAQPAKHIPGWNGGDDGSTLHPKKYQKLAGPWIDGVDPAKSSIRLIKWQLEQQVGGRTIPNCANLQFSICILQLAICNSVGALSTPAQTILHVSPHGDDASDGSLAHPLKTLRSAQHRCASVSPPARRTGCAWRLPPATIISTSRSSSHPSIPANHPNTT